MLFPVFQGEGASVGVMIPRITLKAEYGEDGSFGEVSLLCLGYGLHQAWVFSSMFSPQAFFGVSALPVDALFGSRASVSLMMAVSVVFYALLLIVAGATDQRFLARYTSRRFMAAGAAAMSVGTLCALVPGGWVLEALSGVLTGLGSAALILSWGIEFARCDGLSIAVNTAIATLISVAVYAVVLHSVPMPFSGLLMAAVPLFELAILIRTAPAPYYERGDVPAFNPLPVKRASFLAALCVPVALLGFALGSLRSASLQVIVPSMSITTEFAMLAASGCAAALVLVSALVLCGDGAWSNLFRIIVPVIAVAVLFLPESIAGSLTPGSFVLLTAYLCFEALIWTYFGELSQRFRLSPILVFGFGRGVLALFVFAGTAAPLFSESFERIVPLGAAGVSLVVLTLVVVGYSMLPSERDMQRLIVPCPFVDAAASGAFAASGPIAADSAARTQAGCSVEGASVQGKASEGGTMHAASDGVACGGGRDADAGEDVGAGRSKRWFKQNCEIVANRYLLSRREADVLFLLAKGYNSAAIQEKLFIAEGTAKTHIRHIYRKLDVHTQQDLMRMVEQADR